MKKGRIYIVIWALLLSTMMVGCSTGATPESATAVVPEISSQQITVGGTTINIADIDDMDMDLDFHDQDVVSSTLSPLDDDSEASSSPSINNTSDSQMLTHITSGGNYTLRGFQEKMITIDAGTDEVQLIFDGVTIHNPFGPALWIRSAKRVIVTLLPGSRNTLSDGKTYQLTDGTTALDATIISKADLIINGQGSLQVTGNYKHGIVSKDDLVITGAHLTVDAKATAVEGKDCVKIGNATLMVKGGTDGIRATNVTETNKGFVYLSGGSVTVTAENDGLQAETVVKVEGTRLQIAAGGGCDTVLSENDTASYRGIKAGSDIILLQANLLVDAADDAIHADGTVQIHGGTYLVSAGNDGVQAATDLAVSGKETKLTITTALEGLEATNIVLTDATVAVTAHKNGINAKGGLSMSNGVVTVACPITTVDYKSEGVLTSAALYAAGGEMKDPLNISDQGVLYASVGNQLAGTAVSVKDENGAVIASFTPTTDFTHVYITSLRLTKGKKYTLIAGSYIAAGQAV